MKRALLWLEAALGLVSVALVAYTMVNKEWIEEILHVDPDGGNGSFEWVVVGILVVVALAMITLAGRQLRRVRAAAA